MNTKSNFITTIKNSISIQMNKSLDIYLYIGNYKDTAISSEEKINIYDYEKIKRIYTKRRTNIIDFKINFKKEIFDEFELSSYRVHLYFKEVTFKEEVSFRKMILERLEFKDVTFKKNVAIKDMGINTLILRPYEINANVVVNVDGYAEEDGTLVESKPEIHYINNIEFEDPHICKAKIFFIGTKFENGDFRNRLLDNVVFQNCDFENTYFLNSFLDKTTFLNCEFPIVENYTKYNFLGENTSNILFSLGLYIIGLIPFFELSFEKNFDRFAIYNIIFVIPTILTIITFSYLLFLMLETLFFNLYRIGLFKNKDKPLIAHHLGIADEQKIIDYIKSEKELSQNNLEFKKNKLIIYKRSLENINAIYNDLKINFRNISNMQLSGDFHYSQKSNEIIFAKRNFDIFLLMFNYVINGFGERYIRSIIMVLSTLVFLMLIQKPNEDYISTSSTPPFLLEVHLNNEYDDTQSPLPIMYNLESFQKINISPLNLYKNKKEFYAYDNRYDFNFEEQYIPKLKNNYLVKFYYATSHITYPFTQESKKWFQNMSKNSYFVSIPATIFIWLSLIGMVTAIFNRIRR